ncbi:MAG: DUF2235 domain-containing protein [Aestuariivirga sp.]|nr:DUF2235 domain-containing protein [Aestuariivirga sp.]
MPKNIIVLSDGTGNSSAQIFRTNVWRTYEALDLSDPKKQIAHFDDGVGTSRFRPLALLTGAIGIGLSRNVRELYAFLCRNYDPGDRIYGFGFSRGAFTIRILAGFVAKMGLLKPDAYLGEQDLKKKITWLYRVYRKQCSGDGITPPLAFVIRGLRDLLPGQAMDAKNYQRALDQTVNIEFLGLWDTVDAYGLPIDEMTKGWDNFVWPLSMRNYDLSAKVNRAVHALSLDDERNSFHPLLWNEVGTQGNTATVNPIRQQANAKNVSQEKLTQVWFAGMHADVGGGYPDDFMSYVPLNFVLSLAGPHVKFNAAKRTEHGKLARMAGVMHDSRKGLQSYYRLLPRKLEKILNTRRTRIGWFPQTKRKLGTFFGNVVKIERPKIHHTVFDRIAAKGTAYSPIVLPKEYAVVGKTGAIVNLGNATFETAAQAAWRVKAQERVWDLVWMRRIAYFTTLFFTFLLALLPWLESLPSISSSGRSSIVLDEGKCIGSAFCFLAGIPKLIGVFLPAFASTWVDTFSANPGIFGGLAGVVAGLMILSTRLDRKIHDRMTIIWQPATALSTAYSRLHDFRESKAYQWTLRRFKMEILPAFFGLAALAGILTIGVSGLSRAYFSYRDAVGAFCDLTPSPTGIVSTYSKLPSQFDPRKPCWPTGFVAEAGAVYRVILDISAAPGKWTDGPVERAIEADLRGNVQSHPLYIAPFAWPTRRYLWENYYKPIARIRKTAAGVPGQDEYVLNPVFDTSKGRLDCLVSDFTAKSPGELFLFVNDAVIYFWPNGLVHTYDNNNGMADVYVKRVASMGEPFSLPPGMSEKSACKEFAFTPP